MCEYCDDLSVSEDNDDRLEDICSVAFAGYLSDQALCCDYGWMIICTARAKFWLPPDKWEEICRKRGHLLRN